MSDIFKICGNRIIYYHDNALEVGAFHIRKSYWYIKCNVRWDNLGGIPVKDFSMIENDLYVLSGGNIVFVIENLTTSDPDRDMIKRLYLPKKIDGITQYHGKIAFRSGNKIYYESKGYHKIAYPINRSDDRSSDDSSSDDHIMKLIPDKDDYENTSEFLLCRLRISDYEDIYLETIDGREIFSDRIDRRSKYYRLIVKHCKYN